MCIMQAMVCGLGTMTTGKCNKWSRHKWVGSRGPLAHVDLWEDLWGQWQLLGDSVDVLWGGIAGGGGVTLCAPQTP